ncbi:glycoside hydrolase family 88 protein [Cucurbitaria berberidis CBS 394.84]|uniref:Glycoside hydrolase family 88 protein n=1 Tax=Cucurbitaria berberidis CBS 394.84 TaxID=1168544 RepID=A0A9P4GDA1_9PLEO|nr:glycoside hydrolase family 88 protein [Cucurbitaria berberidis CBS 394.84]KAF1843221.1 glycoside hydrolase family 88 protein [Cucurbitaria berberidis CBS 394.84]
MGVPPNKEHEIRFKPVQGAGNEQLRCPEAAQSTLTAEHEIPKCSEEHSLVSCRKENALQTPCGQSQPLLFNQTVPGLRSESSTSSLGGDISEQNTTPLTSSPPSECGVNELNTDIFSSKISIVDQVSELFAENIIAKALQTAQFALQALPAAFPEIVPQELGQDGSYSLREADFWTCGFFPGTLYAILERLIKYPQSVQLPRSISLQHLRDQLTTLCRTWSEPIRGMDGRTDTHDIGFIIMPSLRADWELFSNPRSLQSIVKAARSLATRYVASAKAIRSWDLLKKNDIEILDQEDNMIVIIDSMCNLDLIFYAAHHAQDPTLSDIATAHAVTLLQSHLRKEPVLSSSKDAYRGQWYSSCHVANIDPKTGDLKRRLTAQGYDHDSTWSRGQAWGILGYAETYVWTRDRRFLEASCGLAEYFLHRLENAPPCVTKGRKVPLWDFDAPIEDEENPLRDSSAGVIAANGMLILSQTLASIDQISLSSRFRKAAMSIIQDTLSFALAPEKAQLVSGPYQHIGTEQVLAGCRYDGMLKFGTANNNATARKRYSNHGLVYGDYYLVEFGNRLLRMGLH